MSSRILPGVDAERMAWRRLSEPAPPPKEAEEPEPDQSEALAAFQRRVAELERELAVREQQARQLGQNAGYQTGIKEGEANAQRKAAEEVRQILNRAAQSVQEMIGWRQQLRKQMEEDLVHLAVAIARRILHRELHVDPEALLGIVTAALGKIEARELHRLRVSATDAPMIQQRLASTGTAARVEVVGDPSLPRGSLILETARGQMDSSVDIQLHEIDRGLADVIRRSR